MRVGILASLPVWGRLSVARRWSVFAVVDWVLQAALLCVPLGSPFGSLALAVPSPAWQAEAMVSTLNHSPCL